MTDLPTYLHMLSGNDPNALLEVRTFDHDGNPAGRLWSTTEAFDGCELTDYIRERGRRETVYIGVAPRTHRAGGRAAVNLAHVLWCDCDTPESVERLRAFTPEPTMTVASGTPGNMHAYWALTKPLPAAWVLRANQRLAHALGADPKCAEVARVLRPPETLNYKHSPPAPVDVASWTGERFTPMQVVADLPDPPQARKHEPRRARVEPLSDDLAAISPMEYVPRLTGREPDARGRIECPFHFDANDRAFHVYPTPERGWHCFDCERGGSIFDLAAALWDLGTRGDDFRRLRERLAREMGTV